MKLHVYSVLLLVLPLLSISTNAQDNEFKQRKFTYGFEISKLQVLSEPYRSLAKSGAFVKFNFGYNYSQRLCFGLSAGLNTYKDYNSMASLPVELEVKGTLFKKASTPFAFVRSGYSFERPNDGNYGFVSSVGIGYRFRMGRNSRIIPIVGYNHQQVHTWVFHSTTDGYYTVKEKTNPINSTYIGLRFEF